MLKGKNILLRPIVLKDLDKLNEWKNDEEVFKYLGGGFFPVSIDIQSKWMENIMDTTGSDIRYIIQYGKKAIGFVGLYSIHKIHRTAEIGLYIGEKTQQGQGFAYEAYNLFEDFISRFLNVRKLKIKVVTVNEKAVKFWNKCNYETVGKLSKERYIDGEFRDVLIMEKFLKYD